MRAAAAGLQKLALDPQYLGGRLGALAVLHTWTRAMLYHPHVHMLVTGGGLSAAGKECLATRHSAFLMPEAALAMIFRAKFCAALKKAGLLAQVPHQVWKKTGWSIAKRPARAAKCSTISRVTSFAWPLVTLAWSA